MSRSGRRRTPLVGRQAELGRIRESLTSAQHSRGSIVLVSGEAGVGKTRLCREILADASARSMQTLLGRAYPEDTDVAFGPIVDTLRSARRRSESTLSSSAVSRSRLLSGILPELTGDTQAPSAPMNRTLLLEILLETVEEAAGSQGIVWLLEDLHWADPASWDFVFYAARRIATMPLTLLVTMREEDLPPEQPWTQRLAGFRREDEVLEVRLPRLSQTDTERLVRVIADPGVTPDAVERIAARSEGIPLLAEELVATHGMAADGDLPVPNIVRATVRQRRSKLDPTAWEILEVAAVMGPETSLDLLRQLRPQAAEYGVQRLVDAGLLIMGSGREPERVGFRHALLQEATYQDIRGARRRQLHGEIAQAFTSQVMTQPLERAAKHWELAGRPATALDVLIAGADRARAGGNVGRAASLGLAGLEVADRHEELAARRRDLTLPVLGDLYRAGRWTEVTPLARAVWVQRDDTLAPRRTWLANVLGLSLFYLGAADEAATLVNREIARLRGSDEVPAGALLLSTAAFIAAFRGETDDAIRLSEGALALARCSGDPDAEHRARNVLIMARSRRDRDRPVAARAHRENAEFARKAGLTVAEANSWWNHAHMTAELDDYLRAQRAAEQAGTWYTTVARLMQGMIHLFEGRPDEAERLLGQVRSEIRHGIPMMAGVMDASDAHLLLHRGFLDESRAALSRTPQPVESDLPQWMAVRAAAQGWLAWEEADLETAERAFRLSQECCAAVGYHAFELGPIFLPLHVDVLCRLDQVERAARVIEEAVTVHRLPDRFFGASLAAARFRLHPCEEEATQAEEVARATPWPWLRAMVECWRGELLEDVPAAHAGREGFGSIGAQRGVERATAVLRRLGVSTGGRHAAPRRGELSAREWEVAELVAEGRTNAAIAERLFLSRPTVASHVANILTKLDFGSRAQIAAWVAGQRHAGAGPRSS